MKRSRISKFLLGVCARDGCENMPVLFGVCEGCHVSETKAYVKAWKESEHQKLKRAFTEAIREVLNENITNLPGGLLQPPA